MTPPNASRKANIAFLIGTMASSIGSLTFAITASAVMLSSGYTLFEVGLFAAISRLSSLLSVFVFGERVDTWNPKKVLLITEAIGFAAAVGLAICWQSGKSLYPFFLAFTAIRSLALGVQAPGRAKIAKLLAADGFQEQSRAAVWLNKVTHGAIVFAAALSWVFVTRFDVVWAIGFDMLTFLANGLLIWSFVSVDGGSAELAKPSLLRMFKILYARAPHTAILDLLLATSLCGVNTLYVRISDGDSALVPFFHAAYGIAVWATGFLFRWPRLQGLHTVLWLALSVAISGLSFAAHDKLLAVPLLGLVFVVYWLLFHRYSSQLQYASPPGEIAAVTSARIVQMTVVISIGEYLVGAWSNVVPIEIELRARALLPLVVFVALIFSRRRRANAKN